MDAEQPATFISMRESSNAEGMKVYHVDFSDEQPTAESTDAAIELVQVLKQVEWPFRMEVDMRKSKLTEHLKFRAKWKAMFASIPRRNCTNVRITMPKFKYAVVRIFVVPVVWAMVAITMGDLVEVVEDSSVCDETLGGE